MNRLEDAEQSLRQSLEQQNKPIQRALREAVLGSVLREQGRFEEAIACNERLASLRAGDWNTAREIARVLLQQGTQSREALQQARKGVEFCETRKPRVLQHVAVDLQEEVRDEGMAESLALLAWAEAVNAANPVKVEDLIVKARRHVPKNPECHVSSVALIHYYSGRAYAALGKTEKAVSEFECAARLDPKGNSGVWRKPPSPCRPTPRPKRKHTLPLIGSDRLLPRAAVAREGSKTGLASGRVSVLSGHRRVRRFFEWSPVTIVRAADPRQGRLSGRRTFTLKTSDSWGRYQECLMGPLSCFGRCRYSQALRSDARRAE